MTDLIILGVGCLLMFGAMVRFVLGILGVMDDRTRVGHGPFEITLEEAEAYRDDDFDLSNIPRPKL